MSCSQHQHQPTAASNEEISKGPLRAEAPVFVPSWSSLGDINGDTAQHTQVLIGNKNKGRKKRNSSHQVRNCQPQQQTGTLHNGRRHRPRRDATNTTAISSTAHHFRRRRKEGKCAEKFPRTDQRDENISQHIQSNEPHPTVIEQDVLSPSSFPALFSVTTKSHSTPSTWDQAPKIFTRIKDDQSFLEQPTNDSSSIMVEFLSNGLESLTAGPKSIRNKYSTIRRRRQEFGSWGGDDDDDDDCERESSLLPEPELNLETPNTLPDTTQDQCNVKFDTVRPRKTFHRPRINMDRLRDRWWEALAQSRRQREFRLELSKTLEKYRVDPVELKESTHSANETDCPSLLDEEESDVSDLNETVSYIMGRESLSLPTHSLEDIVKMNDEGALCQFWKSLDESQCDDSDERILQAHRVVDLAIEHNKPTMLRIALSRVDTRDEALGTFNALMHAIELGYEDCVSVLLSNQGRLVNILASKDSAGNNIFHCCCRGLGTVSLLRLLLKHIPGSGKGKHQVLSKLMLTKNYDLESTPFHEACRSRRPDFVEVFLTTCSSSLLSKILSVEDIDHQTPLLAAISSNAPDVVTTLIMWRYNHNYANQNTSISNTEDSRGIGKTGYLKPKNATEQQACPLDWAAKRGNLEMMDLLLQFGDQSGNAYRLTDSLQSLLQSDASEGTKIEGLEMLVSFGANPFEDLSITESGSRSACMLATKLMSTSVLRSLVSSGRNALKYRQLSRRRDPKLRLQPEAFFRSLESKENTELKISLSSSLLEALLQASQSQASMAFSIVDVLYEVDTKLNDSDLGRLRAAMQTKTMPLDPPSKSERCAVGFYDHYLLTSAGDADSLCDLESDRSPLGVNSLHLLEIFTFRNDTTCSCPWLSTSLECEGERPSDRNDEVILVSDDGSSFKVHEFVITRKSEKLESAVRFHRMNPGDESLERVLELELPVPARMLQAMIQHFYHGSLAFWQSMNKDELCRFLLELLLVAEEFLCWDLMKEIEMRLMSSDPKACFCWSCCRSIRSHPTLPLTAQCLYFVDISGSLWNENTIFDVLGVTEYLGDAAYSLSLLPMTVASAKAESAESLWNSSYHSAALATLKDCLRLSILRQFSSFRSAFIENCDRLDQSNDGDDIVDVQKQALLQLCLNHLPKSSLLGSLDSSRSSKSSTSKNKDCDPGKSE